MNLIDKHGLLEPEQTDVLNNGVIANFTLGKYKTLDEILTNLGVNVIIEPGTVTRSIPPELEEAEKYWRDRWEQLRKNKNAGEEGSEAANNMERVPDEIKELKSMPLRGLYDPDPSANVIKLYPQEMAKEYRGKKMNELLLSTLAHETMHAYFNRESRKKYPYVYFVEEPLAEFGMLLYLSESYPKFYDWARSDVSGKKTCYKFGDLLMDMHEAEKKTDSSIRKYLEDYKIELDPYYIPTLASGGRQIILPSKSNSPILVNRNRISPRWKDVFDNPPRYFWDDATKTLGLDGEWGHFYKRNGTGHFIGVDIDLNIIDNQVQQIYLGDSFSTDDPEDFLSEAPVSVSPKNKVFKSVNGIPVFKKDNTPALNSVGDGYFKLCQNGKWGVVDTKLKLKVPYKYDYIWYIDENGLFKVEIDNLYGLVDAKGNEQLPVVYEHLSYNNGTYTAKKDGKEFLGFPKG